MTPVRTQSDAALTSRINRALERSNEADPHSIANGLLPALTAAERNALALEGLVKRVRARISEARALPRQNGGRIIWPDDKTLEATVNRLGTENAAAEYRVNAATLRSRLIERQLGFYGGESLARREAIDHKFYAQLTTIAQEFADEMRAEGVQIGLAQASVERVCIGGEWRFLADCTAGDLRTLAAEYTDRAATNMARGARYLAIAEEVDTGGFATVREMCLAREGGAKAA